MSEEVTRYFSRDNEFKDANWDMLRDLASGDYRAIEKWNIAGNTLPLTEISRAIIELKRKVEKGKPSE